MAKKLYKAFDEKGNHYGYAFYCPGCKFHHVYWTERAASNGAKWSFNGNMENPTFRASLINRWPDKDNIEQVCHIFVTDGRIQYLNDCTHHLAGQTVDMGDIDND